MIYYLIWGGLFALGFAMVPAIIYLGRADLPRGLRQMLARVQLFLQSFAFGGMRAIIRRETGEYELQPLRETAEGDLEVKLDGEWCPVDRNGADLHRFLGSWFSELEERGGQLDGFVARDADVLADGGDLEQVQVGDELLFRYSPVESADDGLVVDLPSFWSRIRGQNMSEPAQRGIQQGLEEGGDHSGYGALFWLLASFGGIGLGAASGILMVVMFG